MLVLTRKPFNEEKDRKQEDTILIGDSIKIKVCAVKGGQVRLGIEAPKDIAIFRQEVLEKSKSSQSSSVRKPLETLQQTAP